MPSLLVSGEPLRSSLQPPCVAVDKNAFLFCNYLCKVFRLREPSPASTIIDITVEHRADEGPHFGGRGDLVFHEKHGVRGFFYTEDFQFEQVEVFAV